MDFNTSTTLDFTCTWEGTWNPDPRPNPNATYEKLIAGCECKSILNTNTMSINYEYYLCTDTHCTWPPKNINLPETTWPHRDHQEPVKQRANVVVSIIFSAFINIHTTC